jgi:hypothetical protein
MRIIGWIIVVGAYAFGGWNLWTYIGTNDRTALYIALGCLIPVPIFLILNGLWGRTKTVGWRPGTSIKIGLGSLAILAVIVALLYTTIDRTIGCANRVGPGAELEHCNFRGKDLRGADLHEASLLGADLRGADLREVDLSGANLEGADLAEAELTGAQLDGAILESTDLQGAVGLTDEALARLLDADPNELARALSQKDVRLESRDGILAALGAACRGRPVAEAGPYSPAHAFHPLVLLSDAGEPHDFTDDVPEKRLEPMALRFAELVVCIGEEEEVLVQECAYLNGPPTLRFKYPIHVRAVEARTGALVAERDFEETPRTCPLTKSSADDNRIEAHVPFGDLVGWLAWLVEIARPEAIEEPAVAPTPAPTPARAEATPTPPITPISADCPPNATFIADVTVPDGTPFAPGETFTKTWRIRSSGCAPWPARTRWAFESGDRMDGPDGVDVPETPLGGTADVAVPLLAPADPGTYRGYWQMEAPDGTRFGDRSYVLIVVR